MGLNKILVNNDAVVNTGIVYDITKATSRTYETLAEALGTNGANVPSEVREGGMSIRFVQSSDNKYVQYRLISNTFSYLIQNWQNETVPYAFSLTKNPSLNRQIKELYIEGKLDNNKYYGVYSCWERDNSGLYYQFYLMSADTQDLPGTDIIALYDSRTKPIGIVKLRSKLDGVNFYAILDIEFNNNDVKPYRELINLDIAQNIDYSPGISAYLKKESLLQDIESTINEYTDIEKNNDFTIELLVQGSAVWNGKIGSSQYTANFNIYKITGDAIEQKKDFVFMNFHTAGSTVQYITAWDENDNFLHSFATVSMDNLPLRVNQYYNLIAECSLTPNISYLLVCINASDYSELSISTKIYNNLSQVYKPQKEVSVKLDGTGDFYRIKDAIDYSNLHENTIINVYSGEYDLISEFGADYFANMPNTYYQGLKVGNNVTIKAAGNGVIIKALYTGDNNYVGYQFSVFNIIGSCTIEGINFVAQNTRYVIHDDIPTSIYDIRNMVVKFVNCKFNHKGSTMYDPSQSLPCSIGGGCSYNSIHIYENCSFETEADNIISDLSYHNNSTSNSKVVVNNCYFARNKTIAGRAMGIATGTIQWFYNNNRFGSEPRILNPEYISVTEFNNVIVN